MSARTLRVLLVEDEDGEALERFTDRVSDVPFVVLTGQEDEELAHRTLHAGAPDYLVKGAITPEALERVLRYGVERHLAQRALVETEADSRLLMESLPDSWIDRMRSESSASARARAEGPRLCHA